MLESLRQTSLYPALPKLKRLRLSEDAPTPEMRPTRAEFLRSLRKVSHFLRVFGSVRLRSYQNEAAEAIIDSVLKERGLSFVVMFPRQSGKNMLQAQLEVYLMALMAEEGAEMVKLSPTYQPQSLNAMRRLETALEANYLTRGHWHKSAGNHYRYRNSHLTFLSAAPGSNIVGATASTLLQLDEAQDIEIGKYDKQIAPMAASSNATRVFWGTAWTGQTLLARELRAAQEAEARDGIQRVFRLGAEQVRQEVPAYGLFVDEQVARLGRTHPMVRSQFFSEEIDFSGGLFPAARLNLLRGSHSALEDPLPSKLYALLIDLAGEDESARSADFGAQAAGAEGKLANPARDASALTVVEVDLSLTGDALINQPRYRVVRRYLWVGERHSTLYARILSLAEHWQARKIVVDASGVGAGVASFLKDRLGERVRPVVFNAQIKSKLGWGFLAVIDTGRFQDFRPSARLESEQALENPLTLAMLSEQDSLQALFQRQLAAVSYEVSSGPERSIRWGVPQGTRDPQGGLLHDDLVLSASLTALLDEEDWALSSEALLIQAPDPLIEMDGGY